MKEIAKAKLDLHEAYCRRNVVRCKKCNEPVDKSELEQHEEEKHSVKGCTYCAI